MGSNGVGRCANPRRPNRSSKECARMLGDVGGALPTHAEPPAGHKLEARMRAGGMNLVAVPAVDEFLAVQHQHRAGESAQGADKIEAAEGLHCLPAVAPDFEL